LCWASARVTKSEFFPILAGIAGEMGGTNFVVLRSARQGSALRNWITSLTADVLVVP
jgi:hypothetical protein